jgi:hypothetical protein
MVNVPESIWTVSRELVPVPERVRVNPPDVINIVGITVAPAETIAEFCVTFNVAGRVKSPVTFNVPPSKEMKPRVPRLSAEDTERIPAPIATLPVYPVLVPESCTVPVPLPPICRRLLPDIVPERVSVVEALAEKFIPDVVKSMSRAVVKLAVARSFPPAPIRSPAGSPKTSEATATGPNPPM